MNVRDRERKTQFTSYDDPEGDNDDEIGEDTNDSFESTTPVVKQEAANESFIEEPSFVEDIEETKPKLVRAVLEHIQTPLLASTPSETPPSWTWWTQLNSGFRVDCNTEAGEVWQRVSPL